MATKKDENRIITRVAGLLISIIMTGLFIAVWLRYYNSIIFHSHWEIGAIISVLVWLVLYLKLGQIYRAFRIASSAIIETAFSQLLSFGIADLSLYVLGCLTARRYIDILPGVLTVLLQLAVSVIWAFVAKQYFLKKVKPRKCLLLYDSNVADSVRTRGEEFINKIKYTYGHLFDITEGVAVTEEVSNAFTKILEYPIIFIYGISSEKRSVIVNYCICNGKRFHITPTIEDVLARGYKVKHFIDTPLMEYNGSFKESQSYLGKRTLDILISFVMLIAASPIMLIAAIAIKLEDGGNILFKQERVGQGGKVFEILKFRSMIMGAEKDGKPKPCVVDDPRVTRIGKILRCTRLDELPQLFNILRGELSLVGPRPERVEHVELYTKELPEFCYRLRVKAGLTGYAQIYGKYNTHPRDKLLLDMLYIEQQSFLIDLRIVFLTVKIMFIPESTEGFEVSKAKAINEKSGEQATI